MHIKTHPSAIAAILRDVKSVQDVREQLADYFEYCCPKDVFMKAALPEHIYTIFFCLTCTLSYRLPCESKICSVCGNQSLKTT